MTAKKVNDGRKVKVTLSLSPALIERAEQIMNDRAFAGMVSLVEALIREEWERRGYDPRANVSVNLVQAAVREAKARAFVKAKQHGGAHPAPGPQAHRRRAAVPGQIAGQPSLEALDYAY
jgi:hypothetical protein